MKHIYTALAASILLLASCKKDENKPVASDGFLRFTKDGATYDKPASAAVTLSTVSTDDDTMRIVGETIGNQGNIKYIVVFFIKTNGAPIGQFKPYKILTADGNGGFEEFTTDLTGSVNKTASGWSGKFSGTHTGFFSGEVKARITDGSFTNVLE